MSPYAVAKLYGYWITRTYREAYKCHAINGILFNHESPIRGLEFVTRKVANGVAKIALGISKDLQLGNLEAERDWGYAPEYVESMWMMMQQPEPTDFVIATGESHSVKEFVEKAFDVAGLDWHKYVRVSKRYLRPLDVQTLTGDSSKATKAFHWKPKVRFADLAKLMVKEEISRWERWRKGEMFPWDAPNYRDESRILSRGLRM
jgi:GDPmannose 4,6-dehydratase